MSRLRPNAARRNVAAEAKTEDPTGPICVDRFAQGLYFRFENLTTLPAELELLGSRQARLTQHEGRYHQV